MDDPNRLMDDPNGQEALEVRDPGLARERTALAWNRSGLALLVAVAIMLRRLWPLEGTTSVVIIIVLAVGAILWATGMLLSRRPRSDTNVTGVATGSHFRVLTIGTLVLALAGFLLGLLSSPDRRRSGGESTISRAVRRHCRKKGAARCPRHGLASGVVLDGRGGSLRMGVVAAAHVQIGGLGGQPGRLFIGASLKPAPAV